MWNFTASALSPLSFLHLPRNLCGVDHPAGLTSRPGEPIQQLSYGDFSGKWGKDLQERKHRVRSLFSVWPLCSESPLLCSESKGLSTRAPFLQRQSFYLTQAHITHMCHSIHTQRGTWLDWEKCHSTRGSKCWHVLPWVWGGQARWLLHL